MRNLSIQRFLVNKIGWLYIGSILLLISSILLGLFVSSVTIPVPTILHILSEKIFHIGWLSEIPINEEMIIWNIRFPRVVLALCVGASLSLAGAAFQGLLRNPLADPYTIGVSSGASLGAVIVLFFQITIIGLGSFTLPIVAIISGLITLLVVFGLVRLSSRSLAIETIILAGIIVGAFIGALVSLLISLGDRDAMTQIIYWLYGSVGMRGWNYVQLIVPFMLVGTIILIYHYRELNALALGEEAADHIGVNVKKGKTFVLIGASLLTGAAVAVSGSIGFVGLVIPHVVRLVVGPNHRHVLPLSFLIGGAFLILADLLARSIIAPQELPIGVITALIGAPVFAGLLIRERISRGKTI
ncbi:corrinoid ABC transporter permease [Ureibacillus massiliensis 4400831 = CIP 108448 = CCUG 49529]|uniref:Corrinoid ABC transporter permease n=1 Tax=Ureibacillus massiliensis 4400831 = CIP 108448 = CCUG 49529 TaxID=1211035 RepID=A0A0A3J5L7_9BACL|nr:iron ABC transporter permease [Ureibacillus massiliensis]KGR92304.1 corrinoid ABC transporter permease [Ureibacillus massiliensis 4400831 = CIP 108448 = CCUG 49529]